MLIKVVGESPRAKGRRGRFEPLICGHMMQWIRCMLRTEPTPQSPIVQFWPKDLSEDQLPVLPQIYMCEQQKW